MCGACDRCGEYPTGPRISPSPGTRAFAFGGELSAERVCLPEAYLRTPGTHRSYERALLYRMPNGVPHVIASTQHASLNQSDKINSIKSDVSNPICVYRNQNCFYITESIQIRVLYVLNRRRETAQHNRIAFNPLRSSIGGGKPHNIIVIPNRFKSDLLVYSIGSGKPHNTIE